ncbi:hypothetical protein [Micromonospora arborensis]|uniref:hypothetical protein n=1 Tax=Micromonospora arborensis TaxID=2116518 RepID=UPI003722B86C
MIRYEFLMQIRKRSLWITTAILAVIMPLLQGNRGPSSLPDDMSARAVMGTWAFLFSILLPIGFGTVLADRLVRDRRLGIVGLLDSLPVGPGARVLRRYVGSVAATAVPGLAIMLAAAVFELATGRHDPALLLWAPIAFALVIFPGLAFIAAFALVAPLVVTAPLFRVLFVGYWFWGNMLPTNFLPSLTGSLIAPIGDYPASWLTGERMLWAGADGWLGFLRPDVTGATAALSIALLLLVALVPLAASGPLLARRRVAG